MKAITSSSSAGDRAQRLFFRIVDGVEEQDDAATAAELQEMRQLRQFCCIGHTLIVMLVFLRRT
jgi:hypothetical protein